jgi:gluconokinase
MTLDAEAVFRLVVEVVDESLEKAGPGARGISGVAMSTFWHSLLGIDGSGRPTTPVFTWADRRAAEAARELRARLDEGEVHARTGCVLHSSYWPAKLLWLSEEDREAFRRTERFLSPGEYVYLRLFGEARASVSMASGTGLLDQDRKRYDEGVLDALPVERDRLSPVSDEPLRGLAGEWAKRWPALAEVPWFPAYGDGACSNVGSGCVGRGRLAVMVGTSGAMRVLWKAGEAKTPEGLWRYRSDGSRFVVGGALSDGGNLVAWLRETLRLPDEGETERLLREMEPGAHGLVFLPLLAGERGPGWADTANGTISGLCMTTTPVEILRSAMEAVALRFALILERIDDALPAEGRTVIASGGGLLNSRAWATITANALNRPLTLSGVDEASSRGAALLATEALGGPEVEEVEAPLGETIEPEEDRHEAYQKALERQRALYEAVLDRAGHE